MNPHVYPFVAGTIVFAVTLGGAFFGMWMRAVLPAGHLDQDSKDTVKLGIGLVATMSALVLGLVTASAKTTFDAVDTAVKSAAMDVLTLDRLLARYGPETASIRAHLQRTVASRIEMIWPQRGPSPDLELAKAPAEVEALADGIRALTPASDAQRWLQSRAQEGAESLLRVRWLVSARSVTSVPIPFLSILLFWLLITFASFGLFAPRNATVVAVLVVCALSVAAAVFLVLEMDGPFVGILRVSSDPLRYAYAHLNK
jgi:hypothetical protein